MRLSKSGIAVVLVMLSFAFLGGCFMPGSTPTPTPGPTAKLEILDWSLQPYDNMFMPWVITGHAKNVSGKELSYAEVDGQFFDSQNVLIGSWFDNISNLGAGIVWEFNIHLMDSEVADRAHHATVEVGSCW